MDRPAHHIAFGPVPSRRLGRSLGINHVPTKVCSYACIYCQIGPTTEKIIEPRRFFTPEQIYAEVASQLGKVQALGQLVDYLTFVPDGEPTLDATLGDSIEALKGLSIRIAVITNATLLWREDVRARIGKADLVSVKVDTVAEDLWRRINAPHSDLRLRVVLQGIRDFATGYTGDLITDSMLLAGLNDTDGALVATADFLASIAPQTSYLAVPTRPTTVAGVRGTDVSGLKRAHAVFAARLPRVELLVEEEEGTFAHTGEARADVLAITAVHPMREATVRRLLEVNHAQWSLIETLLSEGALQAVEFEGERFYVRPVTR